MLLDDNKQPFKALIATFGKPEQFEMFSVNVQHFTRHGCEEIVCFTRHFVVSMHLNSGKMLREYTISFQFVPFREKPFMDYFDKIFFKQNCIF